jgi:hypothetical protein
MEIICGSVVRIPFETSMYVHTFWHVSDENWGQVRINFVMFVYIHVATREPQDTYLLHLIKRVEINVTTYGEGRSQWPRGLMICMPEVLGCNLGRDTNYPDRNVCALSQSFQLGVAIVPLIRPRSHPSRSFQINYSIVPSRSFMYSEMLTSLILKTQN